MEKKGDNKELSKGKPEIPEVAKKVTEVTAKVVEGTSAHLADTPPMQKGDKNNIITTLALVLGVLISGYFYYVNEEKAKTEPEKVEEIIPETPSEPVIEEPAVIDSLPVIPLDTPSVSQVNVDTIMRLKLELQAIGKQILEARTAGDEALVKILGEEQIRVNKLLNKIRKE